MMNNCLAEIMSLIDNPCVGLPDEVFYFVSRVTPLVNVDLLIKNDNGHTLLTWRDDDFHGPGWHIPGGIIRFKETAEARIQKVALNELGVMVNAESTPMAINELMAKDRDERGHFISMLYRCTLSMPPAFVEMAYKGGVVKSGQWMWHDMCPNNIIHDHLIYKKFIDDKNS